MTAARTKTVSSPGPHRWSYRVYQVHERATPFGRRFEIRSPKDELVASCKVKRSDPQLVFFGDEDETQQLFRLEPAAVRQFDRAYDVVDPLGGRTFAQLRKKYYKPLGRSEWFIHNGDGELIGMVTETAPSPSLLRRLLPVDRLFPKAWAIHWGQSIGGIIQPKPGLMGERLEVNLTLDKRQEVDRRLALGVTVALRADLHGSPVDGKV